jgi:hypothetical protein
MCEICIEDPPESHGEFFVDLSVVRYIMPAMLLHYIQVHGYRPPDVFVDSLEKHWSEHGQEILDSNSEARCTLNESERFGRLEIH